MTLTQGPTNNPVTSIFQHCILHNNKYYGIVVTGHSLGAAVSVLLTLQLLINTNDNMNERNTRWNKEKKLFGEVSSPSVNNNNKSCSAVEDVIRTTGSTDQIEMLEFRIKFR